MDQTELLKRQTDFKNLVSADREDNWDNHKLELVTHFY